MKKLIAIVAFGLLAAGQAFAGDNVSMDFANAGKTLYGETTGGTASATTTLIGKTSTGVALGAKSGAAGYAMITQHKSGNRAFATSFDSTSVFYEDVTNVGTAVLAVPTQTDSTDFGSWTSM